MGMWPERTARGEEILSPPETPPGPTGPGESSRTHPSDGRATDDLEPVRVRRFLSVKAS